MVNTTKFQKFDVGDEFEYSSGTRWKVVRADHFLDGTSQYKMTLVSCPIAPANIGTEVDFSEDELYYFEAPSLIKPASNSQKRALASAMICCCELNDLWRRGHDKGCPEG